MIPLSLIPNLLSLISYLLSQFYHSSSLAILILNFKLPTFLKMLVVLRPVSVEPRDYVEITLRLGYVGVG